MCKGNFVALNISIYPTSVFTENGRCSASTFSCEEAPDPETSTFYTYLAYKI